MPWRMGCQAPMCCAFSGTSRRNWVVIFQASTRISIILLSRARAGARGKEATNRVTKPNWMAVRNKRFPSAPGINKIINYSVYSGSVINNSSCKYNRQSANNVLPSHPSQGIHRTVLVLSWVEAGSPAPSEESLSPMSHGRSGDKLNSSTTLKGWKRWRKVTVSKYRCLFI